LSRVRDPPFTQGFDAILKFNQSLLDGPATAPGTLDKHEDDQPNQAVCDPEVFVSKVVETSLFDPLKLIFIARLDLVWFLMG